MQDRLNIAARVDELAGRIAACGKLPLGGVDELARRIDRALGWIEDTVHVEPITGKESTDS